MASKMYDVAVKTGSYTDKTGATKNRYENIGVCLTSVISNPPNAPSAPREYEKFISLLQVFFSLHPAI